MLIYSCLLFKNVCIAVCFNMLKLSVVLENYESTEKSDYKYKVSPHGGSMSSPGWHVLSGTQVGTAPGG